MVLMAGMEEEEEEAHKDLVVFSDHHNTQGQFVNGHKHPEHRTLYSPTLRYEGE